jgi:hypothetical protein
MFVALREVMLAPEKLPMLDPVPPLRTGRTPSTVDTFTPEVDPVPPLAIGRTPVTVDTFGPELDPVPPEVIGSGVARVKELKYVIASTTPVPVLNTYVVLLAGTETFAPDVFLTSTASPHPLLTI